MSLSTSACRALPPACSTGSCRRHAAVNRTCFPAQVFLQQSKARKNKSTKNKAASYDSASQDKIREARTSQLQATELLAKLLEAKDTRACAKQHLNSLTQHFFLIASTYMEMARKEGDAEVVARLEKALKIAMEEVQATLRPEIQLLNKLLAAKTGPDRAELLQEKSAADVLQMNGGYFFTLLERMQTDVDRQRASDVNTKLKQQLKDIHKQASSRVSRVSMSKGFGT